MPTYFLKNDLSAQTLGGNESQWKDNFTTVIKYTAFATFSKEPAQT